MPPDRHWKVTTSSGVYFDEVTQSLNPSDWLSKYSQSNNHALTEILTCFPEIQKACFVGQNTININSFTHMIYTLISLAAWAKAWVCDRSLAGIVGSNPAGGMDICLLGMLCCQVEVSASGWSLVQRSPTKCAVSNWVWLWIHYCHRVATQLQLNISYRISYRIISYHLDYVA